MRVCLGGLKYDVKESIPPFSSQVIAALGREVQSNFGQQNSAAVGWIGTHLIALIRSNAAPRVEVNEMLCQQPGLHILKKLQGFHYFSLELIWGHVTMHVHSPHRLLQTSKKVPVEEGRACHQKNYSNMAMSPPMSQANVFEVNQLRWCVEALLKRLETILARNKEAKSGEPGGGFVAVESVKRT